MLNTINVCALFQKSSLTHHPTKLDLNLSRKKHWEKKHEYKSMKQAWRNCCTARIHYEIDDQRPLEAACAVADDDRGDTPTP